MKSGKKGDPQALSGLGGIGKTQTALAYLYEHRNDYGSLFWVNAETVPSLTDGLANLAAELGLLPAGSGTRQDALTKIYQWFREEGEWLLVLDNADDLATLAPHFPHYHSGHLLLTTRAQNTVRWAAPRPLLPFGHDEGALLLLRRAGKIGADETLTAVPAAVARAAKAISGEMGGLPLALSQAGAYLAETQTDLTNYLTLYRRKGMAFLDHAGEPDHAPVMVTFRLALERLEKRGSEGRAAGEMLRLCAFLEPDALPESLFTAYSTEARAAVCAYSLLTWNPDNKTFTVHRLVQQAIRALLTADEQCLWKKQAVQTVSDATPDFEFADWELCELLLPQWRLCARYVREEGISTSQATTLLYQAGRYLRARALYEESAAFLQNAVTLAEQSHGLTHPATADCLDELACLYREIDRPEDAEPLHVRALAITEQTTGPESRETASKLHNLALFHAEQKQYDQAETLFQRSLSLRETSPEDALLKAATLTQLAGVYRYQSAFAKAEPLFRRALEIYESLLEPNHIDIATACNNLGLLCAVLTEYPEAEALFLRALRINEQSRGKEHPETGTVVWSLAWVRWKQSRPDEADPLFQRAIHIYTAHFDQNHARVVRLLGQYGDFQKEYGR